MGVRLPGNRDSLDIVAGNHVLSQMGGSGNELFRRPDRSDGDGTIREIAEYQGGLGSGERNDGISMNVNRARFHWLGQVRIDAGRNVYGQHKARSFVDANDCLFRNAFEWRLESSAQNRIENEIGLERLLDLRLAEIVFGGDPQSGNSKFLEHLCRVAAQLVGPFCQNDY